MLDFRDSGVEFYELHDFHSSGVEYLICYDFLFSDMEFYEFCVFLRVLLGTNQIFMIFVILAFNFNNFMIFHDSGVE